MKEDRSVPKPVIAWVRQRTQRGLDALAFAGVWAGLTAGALTWAAAAALSPDARLPGLFWACGLAIGGTVIVYSVDRLRDVDRDAASSPGRTAFVRRHRRGLTAGVGGAAAFCSLAALRLPASVWVLCTGVAVLGLLHRRLKTGTAVTLVYVSGAWVAIVIGLPVLLIGPGELPWLDAAVAALCLGLAIASNVIASTLRGRGFDAAAVRALRSARRLAVGATLLPLVVPGLAGIAAVGAFAWLAIAFFRPDERYGLVVLDGALLAGGVTAALLLGSP